MSISIFGDSVMKGVVLDGRKYRLNTPDRKALEAENGLAVNNHCRFGATTSNGLTILRSSIRKEGLPAYTLLAFGDSDCDYLWADIADAPDGKYSCRTTIADFEAKYTAMIREIRANGSEPILVTLPPISAERYLDWRCEKDHLDRARLISRLGDVNAIYRRQERYSRCIESLAEKNGCRLIDLRTAFLDNPHSLPELLCADGVHPNHAGQQVIYHEIGRYLALSA